MRLLINASTLVKGGALQAATSLFVAMQNQTAASQWYWAVSPELEAQLTRMQLVIDSSRLRVICPSPARNRHSRRLLKETEEEIRPDAVFTIFGPAYVQFSVPHLCGMADGWVSHSTSRAYRSLGSTFAMARMFATVLYKRHWFRRADGWVVESRVAKQGLIQRSNFCSERIFVVPNGCGGNYIAAAGRRPFPNGGDVRILCVSAYYPSKNLESIPDIAKAILSRRPSFKFKFVITLPTDGIGAQRIAAKARMMNVLDHIENVGPVSVADGPDLYRRCDIAILPSVLETFSANYPEAMAVGLPIVTTDFDFSREACRDAALYYDSANADAAAAAIVALVEDGNLWELQIDRGKEVLALLPKPGDKAQAYLSLLSKMQV